MLHKSFPIVACMVFTAQNAYAYLDPGTGSVLVNLLIGFVAVAVYSLKGAWYRLSGIFSGGRRDKSLEDPEEAVVIYSEGGNYWNVFLPLVENLTARGATVAYYTCGENDEGLTSGFPGFRAVFIGNGHPAFILMSRIKAKLVIMTTPQLDILQLRRSKHVVHYSHLIHAPTDALVYKKFAFDYFDSVMCSGEHQKTSIRELERVRELPEKLLLDTGLTYMDVLERNKAINNHKELTGIKHKILVAPTWGGNGMLGKFGAAPVVTLLEEGFNVTLRPHPQMYVSEEKLIGEIVSILERYPNFSLDKSPSAEKSMHEADLLVSDVSGIIFDFAFVFEKPVVVLEGKVNKGGMEAEDVEHEVWENISIPEITTVIPSEQINSIGEVVGAAVKNFDTRENRSLRDQSLFNYGRAGAVAGDQVIEILKGV